MRKSKAIVSFVLTTTVGLFLNMSAIAQEDGQAEAQNPAPVDEFQVDAVTPSTSKRGRITKLITA
jgi:hypothetical protein